MFLDMSQCGLVSFYEHLFSAYYYTLPELASMIMPEPHGGKNKGLFFCLDFGGNLTDRRQLFNRVHSR